MLQANYFQILQQLVLLTSRTPIDDNPSTHTQTYTHLHTQTHARTHTHVHTQKKKFQRLFKYLHHACITNYSKKHSNV